MRIENELFSNLKTETDRIINNQTILTADEEGIKTYEKMLDIIANPSTEDLEFRRDRVLNRFSMRTPFTFEFLKERFNEIIGLNKWDAYIDYDNYILYVESSADNQEWHHEILVTVTSLKPVNMIFINRPLIYGEIKISEEILLTEIVYNYRLGTTWVLGQKAFSSLEERGKIKMSSVPSVQDELLENIASFTASDIAKVRINNSLVITDFVLKQAMGNQTEIAYEVDTNVGISNITLIELLDNSNNTLTKSNVFIPVVELVQLKHNIKIKEGA